MHLQYCCFFFSNLHATEVASCAPDSRFNNYSCNGVVEVKNANELTQYLSNYGLKNNRVKNLNINFNIQNAPIYKIHSPCSISFKENLNHNLVTSLCVHGNKGIRIKENNKFNSTSNVRFESNEEVLIDSNFKLSTSGDVEIISLGNLNGAKTRIDEKAEIDANNLLIKSNDRSVIGEYADIDITNNFSLISNGDNVTDAAVIKENAKIKAGSIFIVANTKVRFGSGVVLTANEVNLTGDNCSVTNNVTINSENKIGNCFLTSSKSIFTVDKNSGEIPLAVNFSIKDEKVKLSKSFIWSLGNGDVITTTTPSLTYTYQNIGVYTASLKYADTQTKNGKFNYKSGGSIAITAKAVTNLPPIASIQCSTEYMLVNCNGLTSYDPELSPLTYTFKYSDGFSETNTTGLSTHAFLNPGLYNVELVVSDFAGLTSNSSISVEALLPPNINPVAKLNCSSLKPLTLTCDAIGSNDADGSIIQYKYTIDQNKIITNSTNVAFEEILSSGSHEVVLEIIDNRGGVSTASANVDVMINLPPTFDLVATPTSAVVPFDTVFEIKNAADSDGSIASINWSFSDNTTGNTATVSKTIAEIGNFTATATVTDNLGSTTTKSITVEGLEPLKTPPVAFFKYFHEGTTFVYLHGIIRRTQFDIKKAYYIIDEGLATQKTVEMTEFYPNTINTVNVETFGTHTIKQVVEDIRGQVSTFSHTAVVRANLSLINPYMSFVVNQSNIREVFINLNNAFTPDKNGKITNFQINYGNGVIKNIGEETFDTYTYPAAGTYNIRVTATTDRGLSTTLQRSVTVTNQAVPVVSPVGAFGYKIFDFAQNVSFYNERSGSPNGGIVSYEWNFGDGEIGYGEHVAHFYEPGDYFVTLTVTDFMGLKASQTQHVTILAPGDELATYSKCEVDNNMGAACRFFALDKFNEINYLNVSWGDDTEEFLTNPTVAGQGIYDQIHQYSQNGNFNLRLDVGTARGQFKSYTQELSIYSPNTIVADIQCSANYLLITCDALGSYDTSGSPLTYTFIAGSTIETNNTGIFYYSANKEGLQTVYVTVKNAKNQGKTASVEVQALRPPNVPPVANVNCTSDTPHTITCRDSSTDSDGTIVVREITFEEGKTFLLTTEGTSYIYTTSGEKNISVRLIDDMGGETVKTYNVMAKENTPPIAEFSCETTKPQWIKCISSSYDSDQNDSIKNLKWEVFKDGQLILTHESPLEYSFEKTFDFDGTILVKLSVMDLVSSTSSKEITASLKVNQAPIANITCNSTNGNTYQCSSNASDPDGYILSYIWNVDGQVINGANLLYNFTSGGDFPISLKVIDDLGKEAIFNSNVTVANLPSLGFSCAESEPMIYQCSASDISFSNENDPIKSVEYIFDERDILPSPNVQYEFYSFGSHKVKMNVTTMSGLVSSIEKTITINEKYLAPRPELIEDVLLNRKVYFDGSLSNQVGRKVVKFEWNFGDGNTFISTDSAIAEHIYANYGWYDVKLKVTDEKGVSIESTTPIYVYDPEVEAPGDEGFTTIAGIDSDSNGIRDDVQRWINKNSFESIAAKKAFKELYNIYQQQLANYTNETLVQSLENTKMLAAACVDSEIVGEFGVEKSVEFEIIYLNSNSRLLNFSKIKDITSGMVNEVSNDSTTDKCANWR